MKRSKSYLLRKTHRYLGIFIGLQLLLWTLGGLYFSWNDIDEIHGDHLVKVKPSLPMGESLVSPDSILQTLEISELLDLRIINILDQPHYRILYIDSKDEGQTLLVNAISGSTRGAITEEEAVAIANARLSQPLEISSIEYIEETGRHHEYREKPLPAWVITYESSESPSFYIGAEAGVLTTIRHNRWRIFDFLWMLHTMDYQSRDDFGNILIRSFSILGLITILSGFLLFYDSSPTRRKIFRKLKK